MPRYLILVRHSESAVVADQPAHTWTLTPAGRQRAHQLAGLLRPFQPDAIFTSEEPKAQETGALLAEALGIEVEEALPEFNEHQRWHTPFFDTPEAFQAAVAELFARPADLVLGEETAYDARGRFANGIYELVDETPNGNLMVVTHGTVMALFSAPCLQQTPYYVWQTIQRLGMPCYIVLTLPDLTFVTLGGLDS